MILYVVHQEKQDTILVKAAKLGKQDIVDMLLAVGADIEATNKVRYSIFNMVAQDALEFPAKYSYVSYTYILKYIKPAGQPVETASTGINDVSIPYNIRTEI